MLQPLLFAWGPVIAQMCPADDGDEEDSPDPEEHEGKDDESPPDKNSEPEADDRGPGEAGPLPPDVDESNSEPQGPAAPTNDGGADGGDANDGGGAAGSPAGTDSNGGDAVPEIYGPFALFDGGGGGTGGGGGFTGPYPLLASDPIDLARGNKVHVQVDYLAKGAAPLRLARVYHSNLTLNNARVTVPMGTGWRMFFDRSVEVISPTLVRLHRANGRTLDFTYSSQQAAWVSDAPAGVLTQVAGAGWQYLNNRDALETYDYTGRLTQLASGGRVSTLEYLGNRLSRVVNPFGKALAFAYDGAGRVATVTLPDNSTLGYLYGSNNNLVGVRFTDNSVRQYLYENPTFPNALTGVVDEAGLRRLTWGYDGQGRPNYGHYGSGSNGVSIAYNGSQVTTTDARGTQRTRHIGAIGSRVVATSVQTAATADSAARSWSHAYDANGNRTATSVPSGENRHAIHDSRGRPLSLTRAAGTAQAMPWQATWHPEYRKPLQTTYKGITTNYSHDSAGRVVQVESAAGAQSVATFSGAYNPQGLLQWKTDARGYTLSYTYDSVGNKTSVTDSLGNQTLFQNHDAHGRAWRIQRPDGTVVTRTYDARGRLASRTEAGLTTSFLYDLAGRLLRTTYPDGAWLARSYDSAGRLAGMTNQRNETKTIVRDASGKRIRIDTLSPNGVLVGSAKIERDALGRVAAQVDAGNNRTRFLYGADGRHNATRDPLNRTRTAQLDALDRRTAVTQPNVAAMIQQGGAPTVTTDVSYHPVHGRRQAVTDTAGVETQYAYDAMARRAAELSDDAGISSITRSAAGDVTAVTDPRSITLQRTVDALGRTTNISTASGQALNYGYRTGTDRLVYVGHGSTVGSTTWNYDSSGRPVSKYQVTTGHPSMGTYGTVEQELQLRYDAYGRINRMIYPTGRVVDYAYANGSVSSVSVNGAVLMNNISYRPFDQRPTAWQWGNNSSYTRTYDVNGRVTSVSLGSVQRSYQYDAAGRIVAQTDVGPQGTQASAFAYDEAGHLISYNGPQGNQQFVYDANGNRRSEVSNGASKSYTYAPDTNRMSAIGNQEVAHNPDGTPQKYGEYGELRLGHDLFRNLTDVLVVNPYRHVSGSYRYDGLGRRISKAYNIANSYSNNWYSEAFLYDEAGRLLSELQVESTVSSGLSIQDYIWLNGLLVGAVIGGQLYSVNTDNLGTPRSVVKLSTGEEVWRWDSDPFGTTAPVVSATSPIRFNFRFPGQYYDPETGLHFNNARYYDPKTGRYLQPDPLGLGGGMSRYNYVAANPLSDADPLGLASITIGLFPGLGGQITIGQNPNGSGFLSLQFGFGIGGGFSYNPAGTSPGYRPCQCDSWTLGYGLYSEAAIQAGPAKYAVEGKVGRNENSCSSSQYADVSAKATLKDSIGVKGTASAGGQLTLAGGGSAAGGCTCGS